MKIPRNAPCPCGSGKKYKKCCGNTVSQEADSTSFVPSGGGRQPLPWTPDTAIHNYADLVRKIGELKPPPPGCIRVYRGQSADFGRMLASGLRGQAVRSKDSFRHYAHLLSERLLINAGERKLVSDAEILFYWTEAIAQHYGPGSRFLDVTHSLDVAVWFALHRTELFHTLEVIGPEGPFDPQLDAVCREQWVRHTEHTKNHGWIYIFDAPLWTGKAYPKYGEVIDLSRAPGVFATSPRLSAQAACLLAADEKRDGGDLSACYVCDPKPVSWPMRGSTRLNASVDEIFPPPSKDHWYARFLSIPLRKRPSEDGGVAFGQALPVSLYEYSNPEDTADVRRHMISLPLKFVFPMAEEMLSDITARQHMPDWVQRHPISEATIILVESPLMHGLPRADSLFWNEALLTCDISPFVETFNISDQPAGQVSIENVFFEFSSMEMTGWERVEQPGTRMDPLRGAWLVRDGAQFVFYLVFQILQPVVLEIFGPLRIELGSSGRLVWRVNETAEPGDKPSELAARALYAALMILRELSPTLKPSAIPAQSLERKNGSWAFCGLIREAAARLIKTVDFHDGREYCFLTELSSREPFVKPEKSIGAFLLDSEVPWPEIDAEVIRGKVWETVIKAWYDSGQPGAPPDFQAGTQAN